MTDIKLQCHCGAVQGIARDCTASNGNRVVCCCDDCQAFADHLQCQQDILDEFGGTEIYQTSQSQVEISSGKDQLRSLRLRRKGLLRWYTSCCDTPVGNTINAGMPFIGIIHNFMAIENRQDRDTQLGPVKAVVQTKHARGIPNYPKHSAKFPLTITLRIIGQMLMWKIRGKNKPSAFFTDDGFPIVKPIIVNEQG